MNDRIPEDKPTRVPARASQWWNPPSVIDLEGTEGLTDIRGDRATSAILLEREPTDRKAGCGRSACPVWREGERTPALPTPIGRKFFAQISWALLPMPLGVVMRRTFFTPPRSGFVTAGTMARQVCSGFSKKANSVKSTLAL